MTVTVSTSIIKLRSQLNKGTNLKLNEQGIAHLLIIAVIGGLFVTGTGVTVAANSSKPGDALYSIDRKAETVQLALAPTSGLKLGIRKSIAEERLLEIKELLEEKEVDTDGIENALSNFNEQESKIKEYHSSDGDLDDDEKAEEQDLEEKKSEIDKVFEGQQKSLESQRELLKKQYEQALKSGDTETAKTLKTQIDGYENLLKQNETQREDQKQAEEEQSEADKKAAEAEKKAAEEQAEADKKAAEQ